MNRRILFQLLVLVFISASQLLDAEQLREIVPVSYQGRFRPAEAYARLWLHDMYHAQQLKPADWPDPSPVHFLWQLHLRGSQPFKGMPLFWLGSAELKKSLGLDPLSMRASYQTLHQALYENPQTSQTIIQRLIKYHFFKAYLDTANRHRSTLLELSALAPGLWVQWDKQHLKIATAPPNFNWKLEKGQSWSVENSDQGLKQKKWAEEIIKVIAALQQFDSLTGTQLPYETAFQDAYETLKKQHASPKEIALSLDRQYPLVDRLKAAGSLWKILPGRYQSGEWFSPHAFNVHIYSPQQDHLVFVSNFTLFSDADFNALRQAYQAWEKTALQPNAADSERDLQNQFFAQLNQAYQSLAGQVYKEALGKSLSYPTQWQLKAEAFYYRFPLLPLLIGLYALAAFVLFLAYRLPTPFLTRFSFTCLILAFVLHTLILLFRCFILARAPVSNMFETVLYVPWVAVLTSLILKCWMPQSILLFASATTSLILLTILQVTDLNHHLDQVQAVLDSQFWLIIHVLMVVGSYGIFILGGVLGHFYLLAYFYQRQETALMRLIAQGILQTFYIGTTLLITGTLLGGVWAAESWGRFWDWDPKESWAFISSCVYLIWIHAYRFHKIGSIGLAIGSITGLMAISFTWYGVNYILGTGLHSYGFGSGGEIYYYTFLIGETVFLIIFSVFYTRLIKTVNL